MLDRSSLHPSYLTIIRSELTSELWLLQAARLVRELSIRLVLFFSPVFLYQQGSQGLFFGKFFSPVQQGLLWLALFFLCRNVTAFLVAIPLARLTSPLGYGGRMVIGQLMAVGYFWLLFQSTQQPVFILAAAIVDGMQGLFWNSYYTIWSQSAEKTQFVHEIGTVNFLLTLVSALAPIVGGGIIVWLGFSALFLTGVALAFVGVLLSILQKPHHIADTVSWPEYWRWLGERGYQKLAISYVGRYWNDAALVLWPLYVFFLVRAVDEVGYLYSLSLFLALLVTYVSIQMIGKFHGRKPYIFSGVLLSLVWFFRTTITAIWSIVLADTLDRLLASFHWLFFDWQFLSRGKGREAFSFFTYREVIFAASAIVFWLGFIVCFAVWLWPLQWVFVIAGVGVWLSLLVRQHKAQ